MGKSLIYMVNTNPQTLAIGSAVNFGSIIRRYGCNVGSNGSNPLVRGTGYYNIDANITLTAGGAGVVTLTLLKDGTPISGATQSATVANNVQYAFTLPAVIREKCCDSASNITLVVTGVATTINNAAIEVVKE